MTSGNLTGTALFRNHEYGALFTEPAAVARIAADVAALSGLATRLTADRLGELAAAGHDLHAARRRQEADGATADDPTREARLTYDDRLVRAQLAADTVAGTFARSILFLLRTGGPVATADLHPRIQSLHPELCDDAVDRVIDGQRFGKKWKHAVRSAQQQLKSRGAIRLERGQWRLA